MNGRKARALREEAINLVGGIPRKLVWQRQRTRDGRGAECIVNAPGSTRAAYRKLKNKAKR